MVEYCFSFGWHVCKCGFCPVQWVYLCWRMALYRRFIRTFSPLYRFSRHPTHIPRVSRFKPPLSSRSKHLTVQRPWPHHHSRMTVTAPSQSYDRDTKTAKWPWPPSDLDTRSHVTRTLYWSAACLRSLHILGFACLPGSSCYLLGYCSCWGKDIYIYIGRIPLFSEGGKGTLTFIFVNMIRTVWMPATHCGLFWRLSPVCTFWGIISPTTFWTHWVVRGDVLLFILDALTYRVQNASQLLFSCRVYDGRGLALACLSVSMLVSDLKTFVQEQLFRPKGQNPVEKTWHSIMCQ